jgi:hypothetical protein
MKEPLISNKFCGDGAECDVIDRTLLSKTRHESRNESTNVKNCDGFRITLVRMAPAAQGPADAATKTIARADP